MNIVSVLSWIVHVCIDGRDFIARYGERLAVRI